MKTEQEKMDLKKAYFETVVLPYIEKNKNIAIYGAGNVGVGLYRDLKSWDVRVKYFIVTSCVGQKSEIEGIPVLQIDNINDVHELGIIIGVSLGKISGIEKKLSEIGVTNYIILTQQYIDTILNEFNAPKLEITTAVGCIVNCKYCPQKLLTMQYWLKNKKRKREMSFQTFQTCIDKLPYNMQIYFAGMVEPFQNSRCLDMIQYAIKKRFGVGVYTTCVGLNIEDCEQLIKMPIESMIIHVPDEKSYAHIHLSKEYWLVVEMLLNATKEDGSLFVDSGSCQGTPLKEFMDLNAGRIRVESYLHDRAGNLSSENHEMESCGYISGDIYCYHSGDRLDHNILMPDGTVLLCCMDYGMKHSIGNLAKDSYEAIMEGEEFHKIKAALKDESMPLLCRTCTYAIKSKDRL